MCNGTVCGFAQEVREEISVMHAMMSNVRDRLTAFEGYLDRLSGMMHTTHKDTLDIRRALRVLHPCDAFKEEPEQIIVTKEKHEEWMGRTQNWKDRRKGNVSRRRNNWNVDQRGRGSQAICYQQGHTAHRIGDCDRFGGRYGEGRSG